MLPNGGGESQRQNASDSTAATAGMGCCNGKAITERVADAYQRKAQAAASLKDDFAEYNLARRAKGLALDDSIMANKETLMKQSAAENRAARAAGIDPLMVQGDGGLKEKARFLNHADDC